MIRMPLQKVHKCYCLWYCKWY